MAAVVNNMNRKRSSRQETLVYAVLWTMLFVAPALGLLAHPGSGNETRFPWQILFFIWKHYVVYFVIFLFHNYFLAPLLIRKQRRSLYFVVVTLMVACFTVYQCTSVPKRPEGPPPTEMDAPVGAKPPKRLDALPPVPIDQHDVLAVVILVLMLGMNWSVKLWFKQRQDQRDMEELTRQSLEHQLEYLRYQLNPHFFMNTLNNIHALVDIDAEQAKHTIVQLSKLMRFVLYEADHERVALDRELTFLENYIELMRLRLTEHVRLNVDLPTNVPDCQVPPLLFVVFVENAFKHGVSYQHPSFIDISLRVDNGMLLFHCVNSRHPVTDAPREGGVGLQNVRRRLDLIYNDAYTLDITQPEDTYDVNLHIKL